MKYTKEEKLQGYNEFSMTVSYRMQEFRRDRKITQKEMAAMLGVSTTYISNIERGATDIPAYILLQYCKILEVTPNALYDFVPEDLQEESSLLRKISSLGRNERNFLEKIMDIILSEKEKKDQSFNNC